MTDYRRIIKKDDESKSSREKGWTGQEAIKPKLFY